ncbi:lipocalin family protein [Aquimarina sp. 2-A2]|uniref:lipocalin family protein n=1 Tax=Aquimarina sp. 2-A2 TaxID=3382644 RepID=UPI00387F04AD
MKRIILSLLVIAAGFSSCSKDDDKEGNTEKSTTDLIIGTWQVVAINDLSDDDCEILSTLEIKADGTYLEQSYGGFTGSCSPDELDKGTWEVSGKMFTQKQDGRVFENTITKLTENSLILKFEHSNEDGTTLTEVWTYEK